MKHHIASKINPCFIHTIRLNQKIISVLISGWILQLSGCGNASNSDTDREILNNYLKPANSIDLKVAENAVNRLLKQTTENLTSNDRLQIAAFYDKGEDPNRAIEQLSIIHNEDKLASLARLNEGRLHFIRTRLASKAESALKQSIALDPTRLESWTLLASLYDIQNRLPERDQCYAELDQLSALNRDQLIHWTCIRRPDAANREIGVLLAAFVRADPADAHSTVALANFLRLSGDFENASRFTAKALENHTSKAMTTSIQLLNAEIEWDRGDRNLSEEIINKIKMDEKSDPIIQSRYFRILSLIQISRKNYQQAESNLKQALKYKPLDREINQLMVQVQRFQKQPERAKGYEYQLNQIDRLEDLAQKATAALYRDDKSWLEKIAEMASQLGRDQIARAWLRQILIKDPFNPEIQKKIFQMDQRLKGKSS